MQIEKDLNHDQPQKAKSLEIANELIIENGFFFLFLLKWALIPISDEEYIDFIFFSSFDIFKCF